MPRVYATPVNTVSMHVRLAPAEYERLRVIAFQSHISTTEAARRILASALGGAAPAVPAAPQRQEGQAG